MPNNKNQETKIKAKMPNIVRIPNIRNGVICSMNLVTFLLI